MKEQTYQEVELSQIVSNPWNPRKIFSGPKFDELTDSIRTKGVLEPILLRPLESGTMEIVAGERRYRALSRVASENGNEDVRIPAMVRELSDDEAFEIMTIENLQREDLTELEEAQSFQTYLQHKGKDALPELAERTGINPRYIRRRISVLKLPKKVLKDWEQGRLKYGHLEQLARLKDKNQILECLEWLDAPWSETGVKSVRELKRYINDRAPELKHAKFDLEKEGCLRCPQNADVQRNLFGLDDDGARCLDPICFKQRQNNYLLANWKRTGYRKKHRTNGFRFNEDIPYDQCESFAHERKPGEKCFECPQFVTILDLNGEISYDRQQVCVGDKSCFWAVIRSKAGEDNSGKGGSKSESAESETKAHHGEYFREKLYHEIFPEKFGAIDADDPMILRTVLMAIFNNNGAVLKSFAKKLAIKSRYAGDWYELKEVWPTIEKMTAEELRESIRGAAIEMALQTNFSAENRHTLAQHIGIDLKKEWRIHDEYLEKKTIKEMLALGESLGIFVDPKAQAFLHEVLLKKRKKFTSCKKSELIRVFLESGVDLAGKVPEEILKV